MEYTDEELVQKSLENIDFFETLIDRYEKRLSNYISRISNFCPETVEEILQNVFVSVWKNLNGFSTTLKFSSWIYRIAHNETISEFRKSKTRGEEKKVELNDELFIPATDDFRSEFDQKLTNHKIHKILKEMDEKYREILILKFLEEKNYDEISDILKIPLGTVAVRINRAKTKFRETSQNQNFKF
jgi:RNA polymerase sigma-70 factor (ECF subfamily)